MIATTATTIDYQTDRTISKDDFSTHTSGILFISYTLIFSNLRK